MTKAVQNTVFRVAALIFLAAVVVLSEHQLDRHRSPEQALQEQVHLPPGNVLRVVSLGYNSLLADLLWMKTVIYFGKRTLDEDNPYVEIIRRKKGLPPQPDSGHKGRAHHVAAAFERSRAPSPGVSTTEHSPQPPPGWAYDPKLYDVLFAFPSRGLAPYLYPLLWRVVELDPHFLYPYEFGGVVALMNTGDIREALRLLVYGWQQNPDRWELPFYLAFVELFYLGNREQALRFLAHALVLPGHSASVERLYLSLAQKAGDRTVVADYLRGLYDSSQNPAFRQQVLKIVQKLTTQSKNP